MRKFGDAKIFHSTVVTSGWNFIKHSYNMSANGLVMHIKVCYNVFAEASFCRYTGVIAIRLPQFQ